jgi:hypothetical protein
VETDTPGCRITQKHLIEGKIELWISMQIPMESQRPISRVISMVLFCTHAASPKTVSVDPL